MSKVNLQAITTSYASVAALQANFEALEEALDNTLSRDGTTPNQMEADLDMNSNRIINCRSAVDDHEPVTLGQLRSMSTTTLYEPGFHQHLYSQLIGIPTTFPAAAHTHPISEVVNLQTELNGLDGRLDTLEAQPRIFTQATTPTAEQVGDLWAW